MTLLAGIIGSTQETPNLNTSITNYTVRNNTTSGLSITGANAGQLYVLCHNAYNSGGMSVAPATPSGFTSIDSYLFSGNMFSFRLSYKILTSDEATYTLPSVSGADGQVAVGLVINTLSGSFTGLSIENQTGYVYTAAAGVSPSIAVDVNNILIGFGLLHPFTSGGGSNLPSPSVSSATVAGGPTQGDYFSVVNAKNYTTSATAAWNYSGDTTTTVLTNTFVLKPTFSV
jgi:hypothetical protein